MTPRSVRPAAASSASASAGGLSGSRPKAALMSASSAGSGT